jgi:hypothetical protein
MRCFAAGLCPFQEPTATRKTAAGCWSSVARIKCPTRSFLPPSQRCAPVSASLRSPPRRGLRRWSLRRCSESRVISLAETGSGSFTRGSARSLPDDSSAVLIGPGKEGDARNYAFVAAVLERLRGAKEVLDAGAMDVVGALPRRATEARSAVVSRAASPLSPMLLTPHAGELAHLSGSDKSRILDDPEAAVLDAARRWNAVVALRARQRSSVLRTAHCGGTKAEISAWRRPDPETCFPDSSPVSPRETRRSSRRARGEWRCTHMPAARWPHAPARLVNWRENSPVKCRRSCKLSCANLGDHDGHNSRLLFSLPIILIIMRAKELSTAPQ